MKNAEFKVSEGDMLVKMYHRISISFIYVDSESNLARILYKSDIFIKIFKISIIKM